MSFKGHIIMLSLLGYLSVYTIESRCSLMTGETLLTQSYNFILNDLDSCAYSDYTDVTKYEDGFVAVSSNGQIDKVTKTGKVTGFLNVNGIELSCVLVVERQIIAAGNNGNMFVSAENGEFARIESGTDKNILDLTRFKNKVIAAADGGSLSVETERGLFKTIQLDVRGKIISMSSSTKECTGVTDSGEIIHSWDGINWSVFDFNQAYKGFYKTCQFTKILATENQICIIGKQDDGMPVLFYSSRGTVWTQRNLVYIDKNGVSTLLDQNVNDIHYDAAQDQFILACNQGKMMTIQSCSHCNKLYEIGLKNLTSIACNENALIVVGANGYLKALHIDYF